MAPQRDEVTGHFETEEEVTHKFKKYAAESTTKTVVMKYAKKKCKI